MKFDSDAENLCLGCVGRYRVLVKAGVHSTGDGMLEDAHTSYVLIFCPMLRSRRSLL